MTCRLTLADIDTATESPDGVGTLTFNASINLPFDNAYIGGPTVGKKRGCGTDKEKVFCALSLNSENKPLLLKLKTTKDMCQKSVAEFAKSAIRQGSTIHTDGYRSYKKGLLCLLPLYRRGGIVVANKGAGYPAERKRRASTL